MIVRGRRQKPARNPPPSPEYLEPDSVRSMTCWNEYWRAQSVWKRKDGVWACVSADEPVRWMIGMSQDYAKLNLLRRGCDWAWT